MVSNSRKGKESVKSIQESGRKSIESRAKSISSNTHYSKKFCPNCGKPVDKGVFCNSCKKVDFEFKDINVKICNNCKSYFQKNKWMHFKDLNEAISHVASDNIKSEVKINSLDENVLERLSSFKEGVKRDITLEISHKGELFDIPAKIEFTLCTKCSKSGTQYFESVLQLRNASDEIARFVRQDISKQKSKGIHLNKEVRLDKYSDKDVDFYLTKKNYAKVLAEKVKKNFGGKIKSNAQLYSIDWETSKNQYRLNVLLELPNYSKDDVIKLGNDLFKIVSLGDKIHVENLKTRAKTSIPHKESYDILKPVMFQIIKKYPEFEVLDPNTYYQARLMNPKGTLEINHKVRCVIDGSEAWMM